MKVVIVSGGFDPIHIGHLRMFEEAKKLGDKLIIILNNEHFLIQKKGYFFMPDDERIEILKGFSCVDEVFLSVDMDHTVSKSIVEITKKNSGNDIFFANGGDRKEKKDIPEYKICKDNQVEMIFDIGGGKVQSSSDLVRAETEKPWGSYKTYEKFENFLVKRITVSPGETLSLQSHEHRSEFWFIAEGEATITKGTETHKLKKFDHIYIDKQEKHQLANQTKSILHVVEVQIGKLLSEDDITRYDDKYGRD